MRILIAPNAFKGSMSAGEVAELTAGHLATSLEGLGVAGAEIICAPMADGGDGTLDILAQFGYQPTPCQGADALMRPQPTRFAVKGEVAVLELAQTCGLAGIPIEDRSPWDSSTLGLGLAARAALESGARHIYIAVGGSASVDGGLGLLAGLGYELLDPARHPVDPTARGLLSVATIESSSLDSVIKDSVIKDCEWTILVDVNSPACGPDGAALVFGPQKGFTMQECLMLDDAMARWCSIAGGLGGGAVLQNLPGTGAAGGTPVAAVGVLGARIESGAQALAQMAGLAELIAGVDAVVIGEGCLDEQTLAGKAPSVVAALARESGTRVLAIAGASELTPAMALALGIRDRRDIATLTDAAGSTTLALAEPRRWLSVACQSLAARFQ